MKNFWIVPYAVLLLKAIRSPVLSAFFFLLIPAFLYGQPFPVTGKVTDKNTGEPLPGATISLKGTTRGTITDESGSYTITVNSPEDVLVFSFVGYATQEIKVSNLRVIDVELSAGTFAMDELVVVGYGVQKKSDLTGSVAVVDVNEMQKSRFTTLDKAIQGRSAGVYISQTSGKPGATASVKIRGIGSINRTSEPLYVIDGIASEYDDILNSINPADVESIQVLKDASAQAIYGARAANGVIIINTKKGKSGKPVVNFSADYGLSTIARLYDVMDADQYSEFMGMAWTNYAKRRNIPDAQNLYLTVYSKEAREAHGNGATNTDWQKELSQVGKRNSYDLSVSGGNDYGNYFISGNYFNEEGIMIATGLERFSLRANSDFKIGKRINLGETIALSRMNLNDQAHYGQGNPWPTATVASPLMPLYDPMAPGGFGGPVDSLTAANERTNPVAEQILNDNRNITQDVISSVHMDVEIFKGFKYEIRFGLNYRLNKVRQWSPVYKLGNMGLRDNLVNSLYEGRTDSRTYQIHNLLTYTNSFGEHHFSLLAGHERFTVDNDYIGGKKTNIPNELVQVLDQATTVANFGGSKSQHRIASYIGRINYDFKNRYFFTASVRVDGSSRFGPVGGRYGTFPSFSLAWKLNEDFLQSVQQISLLKLRLGWGQTGNENIGDYQYLDLMDPLQNSRYVFGDPQKVVLGGSITSFQANPKIKWEAAEMYNVGFDLNLFENKLQLTADYYVKNQNDMLVQVPISVIFGKRVNYGSGLATVGTWDNLGKVQNRGFEMNASYSKKEGSFTYTVSGNLTTMKNKVIDVGAGDIISDPAYTITTNGHTIGSLYGYVAERILQIDDFVTDDQGNLVKDAKGNYILKHAFQQSGTSPGDLKYRDLNRDGVINDLDRTIIGKPLPDFIYGLNFDAGYNIFDFTLFLQGMSRFQVFNDQMRDIGIATDRYSKDENKLVDVLHAWTPENPSTTMTRADVEDANNNSRISSWFVEDGSFLRIKTVQVGINLPSKWINRYNINAFRIYFNANNLYTFTRYSGLDPEVGSKNPLLSAVDIGFYPIPRSYFMGIQVSF